MSRKWIVIGALSLGLAGAIAAPSHVSAAERGRGAAARDDTGQQVKYASLPPAVKETVDRERGKHELKGIWHVTGDREFYRVVIDEKGSDRSIRVAPGGKLLSSEDVRDAGRPGAGADAGDGKPLPGYETITDKQIKYAQLPPPVRATVDKLRGDREVKGVYVVERRGARDFYRAIVDTRGSDKVYRVDASGKLLSAQEAADVGVKRVIRVARGETDADEVDFDRLPGPVKTTIGRLAKSDKVQEVIRIRADGRTVYRAEVGEGKYTRFIRVDEEGKPLGVRGAIDPGEVVQFDRLPGAVKSKIGALAKSGKVDEVIKYERGGQTYYQAEVDDREDPKRSYFYTVDATGKEVRDLPRIDHH